MNNIPVRLTGVGLAALMLISTAWAAVPEAQRKAELAERKQDMDADIAALQKRLGRVPGNIDTFRAELQKIRAAKGINGTGAVFGPDLSMQALAENRKFDTGAGNAMDALIPFSRELQQRGIDLMVVPYPTHAEVYGYRLYDNGKPDDELWPGKVEGLIKLLENDVEVIECGDAFKAYKGSGRLMGPFDHHFDSAGIEILATEIGRRIRKRYDFAKAGEEGRKLFTTQEAQVRTPTSFLDYNKINAEEAAALSIPPTIPVQQLTYGGKVDLGSRIEPVLVMGDSSVPFGGTYPQGWGIMPRLSKELGWLVPYTSDDWGAHKQCAWYARQHANKIPQPRVVIVIMTGYTLFCSNSTFLGGWAIVPLPLVLSGPGVFTARELHIASESGTPTATTTVSLQVPKDSKLAKIVVTDAFRIASSESSKWHTSLQNGYDAGDRWTLPSGMGFEIGSAGKPASLISIGHGRGWSKRAHLTAGEGGTFTAHVERMQVGTMSGAGTGWWGSMQPEVKWTAPYGVGNDFWGTLDISRMGRCDITAETIEVGHTAVKSWGTQLIGRLLLPKGRVKAGTVTVGHAFPVSKVRDSEAFRPGCEGRIDLNGTVFEVTGSINILGSGTVNTFVSETSAGPDLAADAKLLIEGKGALNLVFKGLPKKAGLFYGLRWKGDHQERLNELINSKSITIDAEALGANAAQVKVFTGTEDVNGTTVSFTYIGLVDAPAGRWPIAPTTPLPAKPAAEAKPAVTPADEGPFRATVTLTKVSVPPDPAKTPYKEAYRVSEAKVTKLEGKVDGVAVGDTILLVEWVMKNRKVLASVAQQKAGETRTLTLTRWEKKLNAKDSETRMIMDDTENYTAEMYWVGEPAK